MSAFDLKEQGNRLFAARSYDDAIGCYTKAIVSKTTYLTAFTLLITNFFLNNFFLFDW